MSSPVEQHRSFRYILRDFLAAPVSREVRGFGSHLLGAALAAPISLAKWLCEFHPELLDKPQLRFAIVGAEILDSFDDGRWYQTLPWLVGKPDLRVEAVLVAPTMKQALLEEGVPATAHSAPALSPAGAPRGFAPAIIVPAKIGVFLRSELGSGQFDFFVLFNPGFSDPSYSWFENRELETLVGRGAPLALSSYAYPELLEDAWIAETRGFRISARWLKNPFAEGFAEVGKFADVLSELEPVVPAPGFEVDPARLERHQRYEATVAQYLQNTGRPLAEDVGTFKRMGVAETGAQVECVVLPNDAFVDLNDGALYGLDDSGLCEFDDLRGVRVPHAKLNEYAKEAPHSFEHILWAVEVGAFLDENAESPNEFDEDNEGAAPTLNGMLDMLAGMTQVRNSLAVPGSAQANDQRLFPISPEQLRQSFAEITREALGKEYDFDTFWRTSRLRGGADGIPFPQWYDLLEQLGWELDDYDEDADLYEPHFCAHSRARDKWIPVFVQGFPFIPDDETDEEAKDVMETVEDNYDTALVVFKFMHNRESGGRMYTCGGLLLQDGVWSNFAINEKTDSLDAVLKQRDQGFDFASPLEEWEDENARLARSFNLFSKGLEPDAVKEFVSISLRGWNLVLPGDVPMV